MSLFIVYIDNIFFVDKFISNIKDKEYCMKRIHKKNKLENINN